MSNRPKCTEEAKAKISATMKGRPKSVEARAKMSAAARGRAKSIESRIARARGRALYYREHLTPSEEKMAAILREGGVLFEVQVAIWTFIVDFVVWPNVIIEVDGRIHRRAIRQEWDTERDEVLESLGYKVIHVSAADLV